MHVKEARHGDQGKRGKCSNQITRGTKVSSG